MTSMKSPSRSINALHSVSQEEGSRASWRTIRVLRLDAHSESGAHMIQSIIKAAKGSVPSLLTFIHAHTRHGVREVNRLLHSVRHNVNSMVGVLVRQACGRRSCAPRHRNNWKKLPIAHAPAGFCL